MTIHSGSRQAAGVLLAVAGLIYFVTEAVTAAAWTKPPYSYAADYISDLGVPGGSQYVFGHTVNSPLSLVMNAGFIANGLLALCGASIVLFSIRTARARIVWAFALIYAIGIVLVGLFHGSAASVANGLIALHAVGAVAAIAGGNIVLVLMGSLARQYVPAWFANLALILGIVGLVCLVCQNLAVLPSQHGVFERGSVYSIMVGQVVAGVALIAGTRKRSLTSSSVSSVRAG